LVAALAVACDEPSAPASVDGAVDSPVEVGETAVDTGIHLPPPRSAPFLWFEPQDVSSGLGTKVPRVVLSPGGETEGRVAAIAAIEADLRIVTWPELTVVSATVKVEGRPSEDIATGGHAYFDLTPATPLSDRWYAVLLPSVPKAVVEPAVVPGADHHRQGTSLLARFSPGPAAALQRLVVCRAPGKEQTVTVQFSQRVAGTPTLTHAGAPCEIAPPGADFAQVSFRCPATLTGKTGVTLGGSFHAASAPTVLGAPTELSLDFATLPSVDGCWYAQPE